MLLSSVLLGTKEITVSGFSLINTVLCKGTRVFDISSFIIFIKIHV